MFPGRAIRLSSMHANSLIARYSALNISNDNRILFRYRLKGANSALDGNDAKRTAVCRTGAGSLSARGGSARRRWSLE